MRIATAVIAGVAALASVGGAVVGYQELAPDASATAAPADEAQPQRARDKVRVRFEPCAKGFELEDDTCVRRLTRTVVVPAAGTSSVAGGSGGSVTGSSRGWGGSRGGSGGLGGFTGDETPPF